MYPVKVYLWYIGQMLKNRKLNRRDIAPITGLCLSGTALSAPQSVEAHYDNADAIDLQARVARGLVSSAELLHKAISCVVRLYPDLVYVSQKDVADIKL